MRMLERASETPSDLIGAIHQIRRRWRYKLMLRGAVGVLGLGALALALSAWGLESWRFSPGSIITFRLLMFSAVAALVGWFIVRPLLWKVSDEQVAMYLEEHEPSLQAEIISAIEASRLAASDTSPHSKLLVDRLIKSAIAKCEAIDWGRNVERSPLRRYATTFGVIAIAAIALFALGPRFLRHGLSALLVISRDVQAAAPYRIDVTPGDATVPRGVDQTIRATLAGFDASEASLMIRKSADAPFERLPLVRSENSGGANKYEGMLFDLAGPIDYFVEAEGVKSSTYRLKVVDLPYVEKLELEFHFPAYTGLAPRKIEDGGDIAVLKGTEVRVKVTPTMAARGGQILVHDALKVPLAVGADGTMTGAFTADKDGFYRFELDATTGEHVSGSPQYTIDVLTDQAPTVSISKPGRDTSASPIEEVFVEARAEDDFGVKDLDLVYSVNGGAEKTIRLFDGKSRLAEVTAGHTFYLEELEVKPGDFVSYFARAADNDQGGGKRQTSDIYFLQVRPLRKEFRRAESQGGGGGGGGQNQVGALSQQQRQIIAATFNINRDRKTMSADKVRESSTVVALSQSKLRDQVEGLLTRMNSRLVQQDPSFKKIADLLPAAVTEMKNAEAKLQKADPQGALEPEQKALQALQKAEEEYEVQVQMGRQQGGGGGGGQSSLAQDLADLFELELDKMANQYETAQRAQQQQTDQKLDELMEKLKELARRQEQEAERQRRRMQAGQSGSGGGDQKALADQAEEAARRLEQLSREENRPELGETARQLRQAADAMRQASANGSSGAAQAASALDKLQEAQRKMQQSQTGRADRDVKDLQRQADDVAREHQQISEDVKGLAGAGEGRQEKVQQLTERKNQLESKVAELEQQLEKKSTELARTERDASRKLGEAGQSMRENRVRDKVRYSRALIRSDGQAASAAAMEQEIGNNIGEVQKKIADAASALGRGDKPNTTASALDKARELARGMESLDQRVRERTGQQAQNGQQGQNGQPGRQGQQQGQQGQGQQGQQGREGQQQGQGQQGREGQQGQSGQQGQQGQGGQQGQQGQQGQGGQQGQQGQGGQNGANTGDPTSGGRDGQGLTFGQAPFAGGGPGDSRPSGFTGEDARQFRGEVQRWTREAEQLRRMLQGEKIDPKEIDAMLRNLRQLDDDRVYRNSEEIARLQAQVADSAKRIEYDLRRKLEGKDGTQMLMSGSDEVPEQFRKVVEQYYRSLSKGPEAAKTPDKAPVKPQQ